MAIFNAYLVAEGLLRIFRILSLFIFVQNSRDISIFLKIFLKTFFNILDYLGIFMVLFRIFNIP